MKSCQKGYIISPSPIRYSSSLSHIARDLEVSVNELHMSLSELGILPGNGYEFGKCLVYKNHYFWTQTSHSRVTYVNCQSTT